MVCMLTSEERNGLVLERLDLELAILEDQIGFFIPTSMQIRLFLIRSLDMVKEPHHVD